MRLVSGSGHISSMRTGGRPGKPDGIMCHVGMDEVGVGKDAAGLRKSDETLMHRGHDLWLATLKCMAEAK